MHQDFVFVEFNVNPNWLIDPGLPEKNLGNLNNTNPRLQTKFGR